MFFSEHLDNLTKHQSKLSCLDILKQYIKILEEVIFHIERICNDQKKPLLPDLKELFPQKHYIDYQFHVLKPFLSQKAAQYLKILVEYWKNHDLINNICQGCQLMFSHYNVMTSPTQSSVLQNILNIDETTSGKICISVYQEYCNHYSARYYSPTLELIAQWSKSKELLTFLHTLKANDIDDLLEIVNAWDETSMNTESVFSLVLVKTFFDALNVNIEGVHQNKPLDVDNIMLCF